MKRRIGVLAVTGYYAAAQTGRVLILGTALILVGQSQAQTTLETFSDRAAFLAATGAKSATGPLPFLGYVASAKVGSLTISNTSGNPDPSISLGFGVPSLPDFTPLLPGIDLAVVYKL